VQDIFEQINWDKDGLVATVAQDAVTSAVLMVAWMDRVALERTLKTGEATYWSRSRGRLWKKGEQSGHVQTVKEIRVDCDGDTLLLKVEQLGGIACHTGRESCFFRRLEDGAWQSVDPVLKTPREIYGEDTDAG
jgi:phosphoribosyl-AMP cyclohydrolase